MKTLFENITSLAELKRQYRILTLANHPDRGGSTEKMQQVNAEFDKLFKIWKDRDPSAQTTATGYENDYSGATSSEYRQHVYEEYGWTGSRCKGQTNDEIKQAIRQWLKKTYPDYKFNVNSRHYGCIDIQWMQADFNPFVGELKTTHDVNYYHIDNDKELNDHGRDVMRNVINYVQSYNYDHGDSMTDYFDRGFYESFKIGSYTGPFKVEIPKTRRTSGAADPTFIWKEGPAHQALKKALGKDYFCDEYGKGKAVLGNNHYYNDGPSFAAKYYGGYKTACKRRDTLIAAGIMCHVEHSRIVFDGYTPEAEQALAAEDRAKAEALAAWELAQRATPSPSQPDAPDPTLATDSAPYEDSQKSQLQNETPEFEIVEYSEKAVAVFGDTKAIKEHLKEIGGKYNRLLKYGEGKRPGWIFSRKAIDKLTALLASHTNPTAAAA